MTWNQPSSASFGHDGRDQPVATPTAPPGVLSIGDLFGGTMTTYRRGFGRFLALLVLPILIAGLLLSGAIAAVGLLMFVPLAGRTPNEVATGSIPAVLLLLVAIAAISILYYVYVGRATVATIDLATGRTAPTGANLAERTRGLAGRLVGLVLLVLALVLLGYLVFGVVVGLLLFGTMNNGEPNVGLILLSVLAFAVAAYWISVKVVYTLPIMAEEGTSALEGLKRSWSMTNGRFWSTLGRYLLMSLIVGAIASATQALGAPLLAGADGAARDGNQALAGVLGLAAFAILMVVTLLLVPVQTIWMSLMYLSRRRELSGEVPSEAFVQYPTDGPAMPWQQPAPGVGPAAPQQYGVQGQPPHPQGQGQPPYDQAHSGQPTQDRPDGDASYPPPPQDLDRPDDGSSPWRRPDDTRP